MRERKERAQNSSDSSVWIPMTDMLTNTLIIFSLFIAVSTLTRAMNPKPPSINLNDSSNYRFSLGSFTLSSRFKKTLRREAIPMIKNTINCYGSDTIELVGHTDGTPAGGVSNLDAIMPSGADSKSFQSMRPGSNADLGLLRALAVKNEIQSQLAGSSHRIAYRALSGGSLIGLQGSISPSHNKDDKARRRIEIRFFRNSKAPFLPRCR
jgi:outer membrane protein OmpA-like peptidoglycan-associated protein